MIMTKATILDATTERFKQNQGEKLLHASSTSAVIPDSTSIMASSCNTPRPQNSSSVSASTSDGTTDRRSLLWSTNMSKSRRSLVDDIIDSKEEEFISFAGKRKAGSMQNLMMISRDAENDGGDIDAMNESLHISMSRRARGAKLQRRCHSMLPSLKKRSSLFAPLAAIDTAASDIQEESVAFGELASSFKNDFVDGDDGEDILPSKFLRNENNSSYLDDHTTSSWLFGDSSLSFPTSEPVVGLPKLHRSSAIRDPAELAASIEAFRNRLRRQGCDQVCR